MVELDSPALDSEFWSGLGEEEEQMQVLRLHCTPLKMTAFAGVRTYALVALQTTGLVAD
jgi:hypothetical protein